jgi:hypothetical protein
MTTDHRRSRLAAPAIVMAIGIVLATGCSGGGGGGLALHPSGHATTPATPKPSSAVGTISNGTQLGQILSQARPPTGWSSGSGLNSGEINSGSMLDNPPPGPGREQYTCSAMDTAVQAYSIIAWWSSSSATRNLAYASSQPGVSPLVTLAVGGYEPGYAVKTMDNLATLIGHCHSFHDKFGSGRLTTTSMRTIPHLGDQNLFLTSVQVESGVKVTAQVFLVRVGNYIVGVDTNTADAGNVRPATVQGFGGWLVQLLQSKSLG